MIPVTVSVGAAPSAGDEDAHALIAAADAAMYDAKRGGRNRVCLCQGPIDRPRMTRQFPSRNAGRPRRSSWRSTGRDDGTRRARRLVCFGPMSEPGTRAALAGRRSSGWRRERRRRARGRLVRAAEHRAIRRRRRQAAPTPRARGPVSEAEALKPRDDLPPERGRW